MDDEYKESSLQQVHEDLLSQEDYESLEVAEEQMIYYNEEPGTIVHVEEEEQSDVPCYVMENNFYTADNMYAANQDHSVCYFCKEQLTNKRFYVHLFDHHGFTKQQIEMMKQQKRVSRFKGRANTERKTLHSCTSCGMEFITKTGLTSHMKKIDSPCARLHEPEQNDSASNNIICPSYGCTKHNATYMDLALHVDTEHSDSSTMKDSYKIRRITFEDKVSFMRWKREMEKNTCSTFFLRTSQKVSFAVRTMLYKCIFSNSRDHSKDKRCEQCPAFIKCCQRNHGQFEVVACFGHLGHEHPTESQDAMNMRQLKNEEYKNFHDREAQIHNQQMASGGSKQRERLIVDHYGNLSHPNGMMILMPGAEEEVEEHDPFAHIIVDDADDDIVGPRIQKTTVSGREVYVSTSHHPGSSRY